ncbi:MAG: thiol reductant ABC exporter subunit CydD [Actinomycetia bacterium]|nr:thiol reductant ABC exporter subunit CydD [Actinomycetes bacterium]
MASGALAIATAFLLAWLTTAVVQHGPVGLAAGVFVAVLVVRGAVAAAAERAAVTAAVAVSGALRSRVLDRWSRTAADSRPSATELHVLATDGATSVEPYVARFLPAIITAAVVPVFALVAMFVVDWPSGLVVLCTVPLLPVFAMLIGSQTKAATARRWRETSRLAGHFLDVMRGLPTLVSYGRARRQADAVAEVGDRHRRATVRTLRLAFLSSGVLEMIATLSVAIVASEVGLRLDWGHLSLQAGLTAILLAPEAYLPIRQVGAEFHAAADGSQAIRELLAVPAPAPLAPGDELRLTGVGYRYPEASADVITGLDLLVAPGLTVVTGPSGAGKTTLLELAAGLRAPQRGSVRLPAATHLVTQRPLIVPGTLRENLALSVVAEEPGPAGGLPAELATAMRATGLDAIVASRPEGLDAVVGDDGAGLSAGQRAALALTRAWLSPAPVVLLDEPTAHLDAVAAARLRAAIAALASTRPVVVATHDPELIRAADSEVALVAGGAAVAS